MEDGQGTLLRSRHGEYGSRGQLLRVHNDSSPSVSATREVDYDPYGNLASLRDPRGCTVSWAYDADVHTFVTETASANPALGGFVRRSATTLSCSLTN